MRHCLLHNVSVPHLDRVASGDMMNLKTFPFLFVLVFWLVSSGAKPTDVLAQDMAKTNSIIKGQYRG